MATGAAQYPYTLTNNTALAQRYSMSFHLHPGFIDTNTFTGGVGLSGNDRLDAGYIATVLVLGNSVFSSGASITRTAAGST